MMINKKQVRAFALEQAQQRAHKYTRVSKAFYFFVETALKNIIINQVKSLPSKGKTI